MNRLCISTVAVALVAAAGPLWAAPGLVRTVRCSTSGESARVVLDLSRAMAYDARLSADSTALIVGVPGAVGESSLGEVTVGDAGVRSVVTRTLGASGDPRVEVTILLDARVDFEHFALPSSHGKPARIVVDIQRVGELPPVGAAVVVDSTPVIPRETFATQPAITPRNRPYVVAIDAGHGGHDTGTIGKYGLMEKKLVLDIAQRVARDLNRRASIRAVMTRETDIYLTLPERNEIAEKLGADVFVSIHLNSAPSTPRAAR
jgi:N-acetylmuramoyl-L-alanine amidase